MPEHDRDRAVERLLRRTLTNASAQGACIDGEMLTAWTAGALRPEQASVVERHVADCARCQALLATFVRAIPPESAARPLWRSWRLPWLVPLATAATAAAIWFAVPDSTRQPVRSKTLAVAESVQPAARERDAERPGVARRADGLAQQATVPQTPAEPLGRLSPGASSRDVPAGADATGLREEAALRSAGADSRTKAETEARSPESRTSALESPDASPESPVLDAVSRNPRTATGEAPPSPRALAQTRRSSDVTEIVAPGSAARWRITSGRQVEWSTSGGAEWEAATIATSSPDTLTAGSAVSASICWLVGRAGAVYVTTNGARFTRVSFPVAVDLVAVSASDDRRATVTAADGRSWRTTDQGQTWMDARER